MSSRERTQMRSISASIAAVLLITAVGSASASEFDDQEEACGGSGGRLGEIEACTWLLESGQLPKGSYAKTYKKRAGLYLPDITQMTSRFAEIIPPYHRRGNCIPFAAIRWPDFGDQPSVGRPFGQICRHSDTPLLSFSPRRRFPRPTPGRVLVADHQSGSRFSGTVPSAPPPRPIGT